MIMENYSSVKNTLLSLYSEILISYQEDNDLSIMRKSMTFYEFIETKFDEFNTLCKSIDEKELSAIMNNNFKGKCTKQRFLNAIHRITEKYIQILQYTYIGDLKSAVKYMEELMFNKNHLSQYLSDYYANYLEPIIESNISLYRMRDVKKDEGRPDNCWHVPFVLRRNASLQRYNSNGHPCLYLADSEDTASKELGSLVGDYNRWCSKYTINKSENDKTSFSVFNLTIPSNESILKENCGYTLLMWLLTYPLRLLCSMKVNDENCKFPDEYIFPQLYFHWRYLMKGYKCGDGFMYSSTKNPSGVNYVFPAQYNSKYPPKYSDRQISKNLQKIFIASTPELYAEGVSKKVQTTQITEN